MILLTSSLTLNAHQDSVISTFIIDLFLGKEFLGISLEILTFIIDLFLSCYRSLPIGCDSLGARLFRLEELRGKGKQFHFYDYLL